MDLGYILPVAPNLLSRKFGPALPNRMFGSDITYVCADEGRLYLAVVLDLFSRKVVGWSHQPPQEGGPYDCCAGDGMVSPQGDTECVASLGPWLPSTRTMNASAVRGLPSNRRLDTWLGLPVR